LEILIQRRQGKRKTATGDRRYDEYKKAGQVSLPGFCLIDGICGDR
jgi:hypothetical protein